MKMNMNIEMEKVDWTKVPVDALLLVRDDADDTEEIQYFCRYDEKTNQVYAWADGRTSWTANGEKAWKYARRAYHVNAPCTDVEMYNGEEVDWEKVPENTRVLVSDNGIDYEHRHFSEFRNGKVFVWTDGQALLTGSWSESVNYAKLAPNLHQTCTKLARKGA